MKRYQKCIKGNGNAGKKDLIGLKKIELKRYIKIILISLHSFSDVFGLGYGERQLPEAGWWMQTHIYCTLMMAKARVRPTRFVSIPRVDLVTAVLVAKISALIKKKLEMEELTEYFLERLQSCSGVYCQRFHRRQNICNQQGASNSRIQQCKPMELHPIRGQSSWWRFVICRKRKELKRYGVIFTCLCSVAIHTEVAHSLDTDSFFPDSSKNF